MSCFLSVFSLEILVAFCQQNTPWVMETSDVKQCEKSWSTTERKCFLVEYFFAELTTSLDQFLYKGFSYKRGNIKRSDAWTGFGDEMSPCKRFKAKSADRHD